MIFHLKIKITVAAVSYFSGLRLCSGRIGLLRERTGLGTGFIREVGFVGWICSGVEGRGGVGVGLVLC